MRLRVGIALLVALAATAVTASSAFANHFTWSITDPTSPLYHDLQATNVPYLAWRGDQVRVAKCDPSIAPGTEGQIGINRAFGNRAVDVEVVDWSGPFYERPTVITGTMRFFSGTGEQAGRGCVAATLESQKAGLAVVKLVLTDAAGNETLKHQFLVGWLEFERVNLELAPETPAQDLTDDPGDPIGNRFLARVWGGLPLDGNFAELGLGNRVVLPDDWARLAEALARSGNTNIDRVPSLWDIHDDAVEPPGPVGGREGHLVPAPGQATSCVGAALPRTAASIEAVDTCNGGDEQDGFSTIFGLSNAFAAAGPTIGPYDPVRGRSTYLPDNKLDAGDAPMPPALINFTITPNIGGTDIGGVGFFAKVDKADVYNRGLLAPNAGGGVVGPPHYYYFPFYRAWIPATTAGLTSSGTTQAGQENNFPGYLHNAGAGGLYDYWDVADVRAPTVATTTACLLRDPPGPEIIYRQTPSGRQNVGVYSDENGEAQIRFFPGTAFFFDQLGIVVNQNGGCDLQGVATLGTAEIRATARYPYQPVTARPVESQPLTKTIGNLFRKDITCFSKGPGPENAVAEICVVRALDIDGTPFRNERVCFATNAEAIEAFSNPVGSGRPALTGGSPLTGDVRVTTRVTTDPEGTKFCVLTDENGLAAVELFGKVSGNLIAFFVEEGIIRCVVFTFGVTGQSPCVTTGPSPPGGGSAGGGTDTSGTPTPGGGGTNGGTSGGGGTSNGGGTSGGSTGGSSSTPASSTPAAAPSSTATTAAVVSRGAIAIGAAKKAPSYSLASARLVFVKKGRFLIVRVNGSAPTVRIKVSLMGKNGKSLSVALRQIRTNRPVQVPNLRVGKLVKTVRVAIA